MVGTLDFYDSDPEGYSSETFCSDVSEIRDRFLRHVPDHGRILDLGCGSGRDTLFFIGKGYDAVPADGSAGMCAVAERNLGFPVRRLLFSELDYDGEFDAVWACSSLLHVPSADLPGVLAGIGRALKENGILFMCFKKGDSEGFRGSRWFTDMSLERLEYLCRENSFEPLELWESSEERRGIVWCNAIAKLLG